MTQGMFSEGVLALAEVDPTGDSSSQASLACSRSFFINDNGAEVGGGGMSVLRTRKFFFLGLGATVLVFCTA
jgi:hypothetical protein